MAAADTDTYYPFINKNNNAQSNINLTSQSAYNSSIYSNQNTRKLKMQLNEIGKTKKTVLNRFKNLTPGSKSDAFLNNITEIIERINLGVDYIPDNLKKIMQINNLLSEFMEKKKNFPDLFGRATEIKDNIDKMINVFKEKEDISIAISELGLSKNIQNALKGDIKINSRYLNTQQTNKKFKDTVMSIYNDFLNEYIKNYELAINSTSNSTKLKSMENIKLLNYIHQFFFKYYMDFINKEDEKLVKKSSEIDILMKYLYFVNYLQPNKSKSIINIPNKNKQKLSDELVDLATRIYNYANSLDLVLDSDIKKFNQLKQMLYNLFTKYSAIFIEPRINRNLGQTIGSYTGPNKNIYNNLEMKHSTLNKKIKNLRTNTSKFATQ